MGVEEFFYRYFVEPIKYNQGYNPPVNTLVYAIILGGNGSSPLQDA